MSLDDVKTSMLNYRDAHPRQRIKGIALRDTELPRTKDVLVAYRRDTPERRAPAVSTVNHGTITGQHEWIMLHVFLRQLR